MSLSLASHQGNRHLVGNPPVSLRHRSDFVPNRYSVSKDKPANFECGLRALDVVVCEGDI